MTDYKKKYDEVLAKAREIHRNEVEKRFDMEWLFPELKESEDERIRKRIIALVNAHGQGMYKDDMLAWLEKQVTPQMVEDAFLKGCNDTKKSLLKKQGDMIEALRMEYEKGRADVIADTLSWLEKQGKKPIIEAPEGMYGKEAGNDRER